MVKDITNLKGEWKKYHNGSATYSYKRWSDMLRRSDLGGKEQLRCPSYYGCTVDSFFKDFQNFTNWHIEQVGYGLPDYDIDKDLLVKGNRIYSPSACVLVPKPLNMFLCTKRSDNSKYGVGVYKSKNMFYSELKVSGKKLYLGSFYTESEAKEAYKSAKELEAKRWANRLISGEYQVDYRVIEALLNWTYD